MVLLSGEGQASWLCEASGSPSQGDREREAQGWAEGQEPLAPKATSQETWGGQLSPSQFPHPEKAPEDQ